MNYTWFQFWNHNEDYPLDYIFAHQIWFKNLDQKVMVEKDAGGDIGGKMCISIL